MARTIPMGMLRIEHKGGPRGYRRDLFVDDIFVASTSRDVLKRLGLNEDTAIDFDELASIIAGAELECARERALRLLNHTDRTRFQLQQRLRDDGYSEQTIVPLLDRYEEVDLLDDRRYSASFIRAKLAAGWGTRRIRSALAQAGVAETTIQELLETESTIDDEQRARDIAARCRVPDAAAARRLTSRLIRRGFAPEQARAAALSRMSECTNQEDVPYDPQS